MLKLAFFLTALTLVHPLCRAQDNCEPMRAQIEANIAAKGITGFTVSTVDLAAPVTGQVVGQCANGAKKIVYVRSSASAARPQVPSAATPAPVPKPRVVRTPTRDQDIITECKDGSVSLGGDCKP